MKNRPVPLQTLHAFEAAARHLSFTRAAEELNLSQSAISQQIQTLEHALGLKLFERMTRKLVLTKQGDVFSQEVRNALKILDDARNNLSSDKTHKRLSIVSTPSIYVLSFLSLPCRQLVLSRGFAFPDFISARCFFNASKLL